MALLDWLAGAAGTASDVMNYFNQKEALKWQKEAQNTTWAREDNAVQRRVADLKAAGLNPVLAAGQGAQSSGPITPIVPHMQVTGLDRAAAMQQLRNNRNTQELIEAQKYAALSAGDKASADAAIASNDAKWRDQINNLSYITAVRQADLLKQNINKVASEIVQTNQRTAEELYNWTKAQEQGIRSDIKSGRSVDILTGAQSIINNVKAMWPSIQDAASKILPTGRKSTTGPHVNTTFRENTHDRSLGGAK